MLAVYSPRFLRLRLDTIVGRVGQFAFAPDHLRAKVVYSGGFA
jgi:hypothetical protein